jgi:hypothetical protein
MRESDREGRRVRKRTLAKLTGLAPTLIGELRVLPAGGTVVGRPEEKLEIRPAARMAMSRPSWRPCGVSTCCACSAARRRASATWRWP